jgi:thiamine kinase-like enzyme
MISQSIIIRMMPVNELRRFGRLGSALASRRRRFYRWLQLHSRFPGLPEGIDAENINGLCLEYLGVPLRRASYAHLSGWKATGAYRLFLRGANGTVWPLIYKDAVYSPEQIPALRGLPLRPGLPECLVYSNPGEALIPYLPKVYLSLEVVPGRHYQYILEDLSQGYERLTRCKEIGKRNGISIAASRLPDLHRALEEWSAETDPTHLLRFDREFSAALLTYAKGNLESYVQQTADKTVSGAMERWTAISEAYGRRQFYESPTSQPIHGDYHTGHIYASKENPSCIRLIDWEWTGLGRPHADLASLLKRVDADTEQQAVINYSEQDQSLPFSDHLRLYRWCQLERGLLDAAFLARQQMESRRKVHWIPLYIQKSIGRVLQAQEWLSGGGV